MINDGLSIDIRGFTVKYDGRALVGLEMYPYTVSRLTSNGFCLHDAEMLRVAVFNEYGRFEILEGPSDVFEFVKE